MTETTPRHDPILLTPIARVHSPIKVPGDMPRGGVPCQVVVYSEFELGLDSIDSNSHLVFIGFFDRADRTRLLASPRPRGVFGIRAAVRPNPLGLTHARLLRREGRTLHLDRLDFLDGTPIVDIKRYAPGWDAIFSATTSHELRFRPDEAEAAALDDMMQEAVRFHGERCAGLALGARAIRHALVRWQTGPRDPDLTVTVSDDGHLADALQALTGARFGNGRLHVAAGRRFTLSRGDDRLHFTPKPTASTDPDAVLTAPLTELFEVSSDDSPGTRGETRG